MTRQYGEGTRALRGHRAIVPFGWYGRLQLRRGGSPCADQEYFDPSNPVYEDARQDEVRFDIPSSAAGSGCQRRRRCTFRRWPYGTSLYWQYPSFNNECFFEGVLRKPWEPSVEMPYNHRQPCGGDGRGRPRRTTSLGISKKIRLRYISDDDGSR